MTAKPKYKKAAESTAKVEEPEVAYTPVKKTPEPLGRSIALLGMIPSAKTNKLVSESDFIDVIRQGIPKKSMDTLMEATGLTNAEMAMFIHTSDRTLRRYTNQQKLNPDQSERLLELARLYSRGAEVFEDMELFKEWMDTPALALGNQTPKSYLDTSLGIDLLMNQLLRIEHGIYA